MLEELFSNLSRGKQSDPHPYTPHLVCMGVAVCVYSVLLSFRTCDSLPKCDSRRVNKIMCIVTNTIQYNTVGLTYKRTNKVHS